jgi:hypothetical protein
LIASVPPATSAAPTRPPTSAWPELEGSPSAHVATFQKIAASSPAAITSTPVSPPTVTMPPIVSATAAPTNSGPTRLKIEAITIAWSGVAARVATSVAIAFEASCSPFVVAKASANTIAIASPGSIDRLYGRRAGASPRPRRV